MNDTTINTGVAQQNAQDYVKFFGAPAAGTTAANYVNTYTPKAEPGVLSTDAADKTLQPHIDEHNTQMGAINNYQQGKTAPPVSDSVHTAMQNAGGVTYDEAKTSGIDLSKYSLDKNTGYYLPNEGTNDVKSYYQEQVDKASKVFDTWMGSLDSSTREMIDSIKSAYQDRIDQMVNVNKRELASFNTSNIRSGTDRYAPGVAQSILTADELEGVKRIGSIQNEMLSKIKEAQSALTDKKYTAFLEQRKEVNGLMKDYRDEIQAQHQRATDQADKQKDYELRVAQFNETKIKDEKQLAQSKYEFRDKKDDFGNTVGTQVFDKATGKVVSEVSNGSGISDPLSGKLGVVSTNPMTGTPDVQSQQAFLQTIPAAYRDLIQGIASGRMEPPSARTKQGAQILSWVARYDPALSDGSGGFDATKYQARLSMQKSLASYSAGSYGSGVLSANKVIAHLASYFNNAMDIPGKTPFGTPRIIPFVGPKAPDFLGGVAAMFGSNQIQSNIAESKTESTGVTDEMAKFYKGTGATDVESIKQWGQSLDPYAPNGEIQGHVQGGLSLFTGQINTFIEQYRTVMGKDPDVGTILQPQTIQTLSAFKNAGFRVDIPGVYYTDKDAYLKNGGSPDNLSQARTMLINANDPKNPPTPENILQLAQIIQ